MEVKFQPGVCMATPGVIAAIDEGCDIGALLTRHLSGDWGDLDTEDRDANEEALELGTRIFSAYETPQGKIWIITEADRSVTTALLPSEY